MVFQLSVWDWYYLEFTNNLLYHMLRKIPEGLLSFEGRRFTSDGVTPTLIGSIPMANEVGTEDVSSLVGTILRFCVILVDTIMCCWGLSDGEWLLFWRFLLTRVDAVLEGIDWEGRQRPESVVKLTLPPLFTVFVWEFERDKEGGACWCWLLWW